jgi:hypothetical protein
MIGLKSSGEPGHLVIGGISYTTIKLLKKVLSVAVPGSGRSADTAKEVVTNLALQNQGTLFGVGSEHYSDGKTLFKGTLQLSEHVGPLLTQIYDEEAVKHCQTLKTALPPGAYTMPFPKVLFRLSDVLAGSAEGKLFFGLNYVSEVRSENHPPPPPVAKLLNVKSCVEDCAVCRGLGHNACPHCPLKATPDDSSLRVIVNWQTERFFVRRRFLSGPRLFSFP